MGLKTRENPETGQLEVFNGEQWVDFVTYRERQIADAYDNSIRFLRDRLGEDFPTEDAGGAAPPSGGNH